MEKKYEIIFTPDNDFFYGKRVSFLYELFAFLNNSGLVISKFYKEITASFKYSVFGSLWVFLAPLTSVVIWIFLKILRVLNSGVVNGSYLVYITYGILLWGFYTDIFNVSLSVLDSNKNILKNLTRNCGALYYSTILIKFFNFFVTFFLVSTVFFLFGYKLTYYVFMIPVLILPIFFMAASIGLLFSTFATILFEVKKIMLFVNSIIFIFIPILYGFKSDIPQNFKNIIYSNPFTYIICVPRDLVIYSTSAYLKGFIFYAILSLILYFISWFLFFKYKRKISERII